MLPYRPHSQGVVERLHKTIKMGLLVKKLETKNNFDIKKNLKTYNETIHKAIKYRPIEIFYTTNNKLLRKVKKNIIAFYSKSNENNNALELETKFLISDNIICKKNKNENLVIATFKKLKK